MKLARFLMVSAFALSVPAVFAAGCGGSDDGDPPMAASDGSVSDRARLDAPYHPDASCPVTIESPELLSVKHVPEGSTITWNSNPPSSGDHFPVWAAFQEYTSPVPRGYLVHDLEHGAVLLLYKCDPACPAIVDELRKIRDALPSDPLCAPDVRVRVILAPDPDLDVPVAAAAWGWTYKAQCVDVPTLTQFARDHYAQGPENVCSQGRAF